GQAEPSTIEATESDLLPGAASAQARAESAGELLRRLRDAEAQAARWLKAIQAEGRLEVDAQDASDLVEFGEEETALALFLLDDRSIPSLLKALNVLVSAAKGQTEHALGRTRSGQAGEPGGAAAGSK